MRAKTRLFELDQTITALADAIGFPRSTVSQAIHHDRFPKVRARVAAHLGL